jgi:2-octaprenyl-6-methoxyphenol hydroxylase
MDGTNAAPEAAPEIVIAGGGLVGLSLAVALGGAGLPVVLVDRDRPDDKLGERFDGRSSAIARGSQQVLHALGIWDELAGEAQPIRDIRVTDGRPGEPASPFFLHYAEADLGQGPMGWIVENRVLRRALYRRLAALAEVRLLAPASVAAATAESGGQEVRLADGRRLAAALVVAADGKDSRLREAAGIRVWHWHYPQTGLVATLAHELPHEGVAHEHFLPAGPFAVLPMPDGEDGSGGGRVHRSSLVWTERSTLAPAFLRLDEAAFGQAMERRFGLSLGRLRPIGGRFAYPLDYQLAERFAAPRLALLGDAAHVIHPIAGQGLNLGLRDVAALAEAVVDQARLGLDPGDPVVLERYQRWRRFDTLLLGVVTDGLNRLFSNDIAPLRLARDLGLAAVNRAKPLKRLFMRHAMGLVGELPRLVRGEAL